MSSIRSSKGIGLVVLLALVLLAAGTAAAISYDGSPPEESKVNETVTYNATIQNPHEDQGDEWTLQATTELQDATWNIEVFSQSERLDRKEAAGDSIKYNLTDSSEVRVQVEVTGDTPPVEELSYRPPERYTIMTLSEVVDGQPQELDSWQVHHYTDETKSARNAIESAEEQVNETGSSEANDKLNQSISAYNSGNFENAESLANEAGNTAEASEDDNTLLYVGVGVVLLLVIVGGAILYTRSGQDSGNKLQ